MGIAQERIHKSGRGAFDYAIRFDQGFRQPHHNLLVESIDSLCKLHGRDMVRDRLFNMACEVDGSDAGLCFLPSCGASQGTTEAPVVFIQMLKAPL